MTHGQQMTGLYRSGSRALGEQLTTNPEPWLARQLGVPDPGASPALREEHARRAGMAAAYREVAGITDPDQAVSLVPHRGDPDLENLRKAVFTALEIRDEARIVCGPVRRSSSCARWTVASLLVAYAARPTLTVSASGVPRAPAPGWGPGPGRAAGPGSGVRGPTLPRRWWGTLGRTRRRLSRGRGR